MTLPVSALYTPPPVHETASIMDEFLQPKQVATYHYPAIILSSDPLSKLFKKIQHTEKNV